MHPVFHTALPPIDEFREFVARYGDVLCTIERRRQIALAYEICREGVVQTLNPKRRLGYVARRVCADDFGRQGNYRFVAMLLQVVYGIDVLAESDACALMLADPILAEVESQMHTTPEPSEQTNKTHRAFTEEELGALYDEAAFNRAGSAKAPEMRRHFGVLRRAYRRALETPERK